MAIRVPQLSGERVSERALNLRGSDVSAPIEAFGGGRGTAAVKQAVSNLDRTLGNMLDREMLKADRAASKEANKRIDDEFISISKEIDASQGKAAIDIENSSSERMTKLREEILGGLRNDRQKGFVDSHFQTRFNSLRMSAARKAVREADRLDDINTKALVEGEVEIAVSNKLDSEKIGEAIGRAQAHMMERAETQGLDKKAIELQNQSISSNIHSKVINSFLSDRDLQNSKQYFADNKDEMTTDDQTRMQGAILRMEERVLNQEKRVNKLALKEPYAYLQAKGFTTGFDTIDFGSDSVGDMFESRRQYIQAAELAHPEIKGRMNIIAPAEAEQFASFLEGANPEQQVSIMRKINLEVEDDLEVRFAEQVFKKNPAMGVALSISDTDLESARFIIQGRKLINDKAVKSISRTDSLNEFNRIVGNALEDSEFISSIQDAVVADYTARKHASNEPTDIMSTSDYEKSIERVLGKTFEFNDRKVIGFKNAKGQPIDDDDFEDLVDAISAETIGLSHGGEVPMISGPGGDKPLDLKKAKGRLEFKTVGDGIYWMGINGQFAKGKDGNPFQLNLKEMERMISEGELKVKKDFSSVGSFKGLKI